MRIFLIGYMGSGKTTLGRKLAARMGLDFVDLDACIEARAGKSIAGIFSAEGEQRFRVLEREELQEVLKRDGIAVATGGGLPCFDDNMDVMNAAGITVYLKMQPAALAARLKQEVARRPVLGGREGQELLDFIRKHLDERAPHYEKAKMVAEGLDADAEALAGRLSAAESD